MRFLAILLLLMGGGLLLLAACRDETGTGCPGIPAYYDVEGMKAVPAYLSDPDPYVEVRAADSAQAVPATRFLIQLEGQLRFYAAGEPPQPAYGAAYATPPCPVPGYKGTAEQIQEIHVTSLTAFDSRHPAGATLDSLFEYEDPDHGRRRLADQSWGDRAPFGFNTKTNLFLIRSPATATPVRFVVAYKQTNQEAYRDTTGLVMLVP